MKNSTKRPGATAFKLKPTMVMAGHATAGAVLALAASSAAHAQAAAPAPAAAASAPAGAKVPSADGTQQVVVTGIRKGIEDAISVKKNNDGIVEAISAEDIGKLPDTTIAESLARLPGVTTQRDKNGNATNISIRGLGPDFNGYLLNGREQTSTDDSRAVDLSIYPAELIAGATVYKTSDASLMTAGLAGTIDNKLIDPLAFPSRVLSGTWQKDKTGRGLPVEGEGRRYSLSYIDQFADRKIGLAIGYVHNDGRSTQLTNGSWSGDARDVTLTDGTHVQAKVPVFGGGASYVTEHLNDKRDGVAAILEFKPNKNFTSEVDVYTGKLKRYDKKAQLKINGVGGIPLVNATVEDGNVTSGTFQLGGNPNGIIDDSEGIFDDDTIHSLGIKNTFLLADDWKAVLDLSHNSAKRVERDIEAYAGIPDADTLAFTMPAGATIPQFTVGSPTSYTDPNVVVIRDQTGWSGINGVPQDGYIKGPTTTDKIDAVRLDFSKNLADNGWFPSVSFGGNYTKRTKDRASDEGLLVPTNVGVPGGVIPFPGGSYVENNVGGTGVNLLTFDPGAGLFPGAMLQHKYTNDILSKSWFVKEDVYTAYGKLDIDTTLGSVPVRGNVGLQIVHTDQSSSGFRSDATGQVTLDNPAGAMRTDGTSYTDVLPSLNLVGDLGGGNLLRFGASEQIARSTLTDMRNSFGLGVNTNTGFLEGSAGNPELKPFKAKALDLSYEKYFGTKGYVSAAVFYKKLDTYITPATNTAFDFTELAPTVGITQLPPSGTYIGTYTTSVNGSGGNLRGIELSASTPSNWLFGFGLLGSWSDTLSSVRLPNLIGRSPDQQVPADGTTIPMPGLSHINDKIELYYEGYGFSAFIAENHRSTYVGSVSSDQIGGYPALIYIHDQTWVSAQVGYEFQWGPLKGLGIRLEGNNLNKPIYREYNADGTQHAETRTGASVDLRVAYKF